jgi:hypothetical protein
MQAPPVNAFSIRDFCLTYAIGRTLAYSEIASGRLPAKKVGKRTVILRSDADRWATQLPRATR